MTAPNRGNSIRFADVSLLIVAMIWGVNMAVMKLAINQVDLFFFNALRLTLSAIVLGICVWWENKTRPKFPARDQPTLSPVLKCLTIIGFSVFTGGVYQILFAVGMDLTTAGNTALIMSSMPMWVAVLSIFLLREKLRYAWIGLIVTFLGTVVVTIPKGSISLASEHLVGNGLILVAALAWALGAVISRPLLRYFSPIRLAFFSTAGTLPIHYLMPMVMHSEEFNRVFEPQTMACILYSGIFSTGIAYAMWNYGVKQLGASHAAVFQNLVPLVALLAAWLSPLREVVSPVQLLGGFMIIFGLFITRRLRPKV